MGRVEYSYLLDYVKGVPDPRKARGKRYSWELILSLICIGLAVGQKTAWAIARWAKYQQTALCGMLKTSHIPSDSTFYRALRYIEVDALEAQIAAYGQDVAQEMDEGLEADVVRGQSIDGKEIRGASVHGEPYHLLALAQHATATILGQCRVGEGTNEIGAQPELLEGRDLTDTVTTLDAIFTQRSIAQQIINQGGHYLMVVKKNQPRLHEEIDTLFASFSFPRGEDDRQSYTYGGSAHGRLERRTLVCSELLNQYSDWPGIGQVIWRTCERTIVSRGERSIHHTYGITSLSRSEASAKDLEGLWRQHWTIENQLHYVRDETLGEDRGQAWKGHTSQALAALRNGLLTAMRHRGWRSIADALRYYSGDLTRPMQLIGAIRT